jgi:hypothetical protein
VQAAHKTTPTAADAAALAVVVQADVTVLCDETPTIVELPSEIGMALLIVGEGVFNCKTGGLDEMH